MKIIIVGAGQVGFHLAQKLSEENHDVVLIEKKPQIVREIADSLDIQTFLGSGTSFKVLEESGVREADLLVAATDSDEINLISCLLGRKLNPYMIRLARVRNPEYLKQKDLFSQDVLGIDHVINPQSLMVETVLRLIDVPGASDVIEFVDGRLKLIGFTVTSTSPLNGRQLLSLKSIQGQVLVGAIVRGSQVLIPRGQDTIQANDLVYVVVKDNELKHALKLFEVEQEHPRRVVIVGAGQTGSALALALDSTRINTKIIDKDPETCSSLAERLQRVIVINGDATEKELLEEESIQDTNVMVTVTGDEESNVLISLLAKELGAKKTITRISKLSYIPLVSAIGIDTVVSPRLSAVRAVFQYIRRGKIISVAPLKGEHAEAIEAEALETSDIVNLPLSQVKMPKGVLVGALVRNKEIIIPRGDTVIQPGDRLIMFSLRKVIPKLEKLLMVKLEYF